MGMVKFVSLTQAKYDALTSKEANKIYFISDSKQIYKGDVNFSEAVITYNTSAETPETLPTTGIVGKLYISDKNQIDIWNGTAFVTVLKPISATVTTETETSGVSAAVSGAAVKAYVDKAVSDNIATAVTDVTYDADNHKLVKTINGTTTDIPLTKLGVSLDYDGTTGVITLKDKDGTSLSTINIPLDNFVKSGTYDETTESLVLTMQNDSTVSIPAKDLVQLYDAKDSNSATVTISNNETNKNNEISVDVKVSSKDDNALSIVTEDGKQGLYVQDLSQEKANKVGTGHKDEILVAGETDGDLVASGKKVGGEALAETTDANTVATEKAVETAVGALKTYAEDTYVKQDNIVDAASDISTDSASSDKVISEKAFVEAMSWEEIE